MIWNNYFTKYRRKVQWLISRHHPEVALIEIFVPNALTLWHCFLSSNVQVLALMMEVYHDFSQTFSSVAQKIRTLSIFHSLNLGSHINYFWMVLNY
jgi:hypothetical protein